MRKFIEKSRCDFEGTTYYALYFGKSKNGTNRITNNHLNGTIRTSTLRRTLYGLCKEKNVKNENDIDKLFDAVKSNYNCLTFCTGSLGANPKNDLIKMAENM